MNPDRVNFLLKRHAQRVSERRVHEPTWREAFDYVAPGRGAGIGEDGTFDAGTEQNKRARVLSSVSADAAENLAANLVSGVTPSNSRWFDLDVDGAAEDGKRWLGDAADFIWQNIHSANFDAEVFDAMLDIVSAGWFVLYIDEDREVGGYTFETWPLSQCYIAASKAGGRVDTIERSYSLTVEQAARKWGANALSEKSRDLLQSKPDTMVEFVHIIEPRPMHVPGAVLARNLPFASVVLEKAAKHPVSESGYHEFPCAVPRWSRLPKSSYATGPVASALSDIRLLNRLRANELSATELAVAGMWIAEDDGVLNPKTIKVGPRKVIVANSVDSMKPLMTGADFKVAFTAEERLERAIRKRLLADQLQPQDGPAMTATEVHVRVALIRQLLGPVFGRMQAEFLQPLIERCFGLAYRAGVLGQAPQSLAGRSFHVKYISPMARSQKLEEVTAIERYGAFVGQQVAAGFATAADLYDVDEATRAVGDGLGVPQRIIPDTRRIQQLREARKADAQQQQEQAQQQMAAQSMTDAMAQRMANAA
jgi:hypothetical protein